VHGICALSRISRLALPWNVVASASGAAIAEWLFLAGLFLLPLVCWPGLDHPFSTPKTWLLGGLDLTLALHLLLRKSEPHRTPRNSDWPWLIWLAALTLSALTAAYVSLEALLLIVLPLPLCWVLARGNIAGARMARAILWGSVLESAIVVLQYLALDPLRWLGWQPEVFSSARMRVYGTLGNPNFVAAWLCATLPLYAGVLRTRVAWVAALALQVAAILATGSRVPLLALPAAALVLAARGPRLGKWWLAGVPLAAVLLWLSPARPLAVTAQGRGYLFQVTASHWQHVPLLGQGPGSFGLQFAEWQVDWLLQHRPAESATKFAGQLEHAHNDYLELWVEYGPVGLAAFLGLSAWLIWKAWRPRLGSASARNAGAWAGMVCLLIIACVDFPFHRPAEWGLYWLLLGMIDNGFSNRNQTN
jgi:O-antigen ligase